MNRQVMLIDRAVVSLLALFFCLGSVFAQETPRTDDGYPDLTGFWHPGAMGFRGFENED